MSTKKVLVIFGATGNQGGSVIKTILGDPKMTDQFTLRAITRDPSNPTAISLREKGIKVLKADLDDPDSLRLALKDADAVFAVTNFHEKMSGDLETQQGKNIADAAKEANVKHLIWSSLPNVSKITNNKFTGVLHFDSKAIVEDYIGSLDIPSTFLHVGVFMNYVLFMVSPVSPGSKSYKISLPIPKTSTVPLISVTEDVGKYVKSILLNREKVLGKQICAAEKYYGLDEIVNVLREDGGLEVVYEQCSEKEYREGLAARGVPEFFQEDMAQNMKYISSYGMFGGMSLEEGHEILADPLETFSTWVKQSKEIEAMK